MMELKPGDILLYPDDGLWKHHFFAVLQKLFGELGSVKSPIYTHAAMISTEPDLVVEMVWPRPRFRMLVDDTRAYQVFRPACDDKFKIRALYWCYMNINDHYSFLNMLLGYLKIAQSYKVCSTWVDAAFKEAGFPLSPSTETLASPNELASSEKLVKVGI